jgi:putative transposase
MLSGMLSTAKRLGAFKEPTDIAIDFFDIPYYGDISSTNVVGTKRKAGTNYAHSFLCADAVIKGERFCLSFLSRTMLTRDADLVQTLLKTALERVSVRIALLDREFFAVAVVKLLLRSSLSFIIPATDTPEIKRLKNEHRHNLPCIVDYTMRSKDGEICVKLALVEQIKNGKKRIYGFITNLDWQAQEIAEYYRNRWGTETNNRKRNEFRAMTTSRSYELRCLYYMLSVAMHNIWILVNLMIAYEIYRTPATPLIETYMMKELVLSELIT